MAKNRYIKRLYLIFLKSVFNILSAITLFIKNQWLIRKKYRIGAIIVSLTVAGSMITITNCNNNVGSCLNDDDDYDVCLSVFTSPSSSSSSLSSMSSTAWTLNSTILSDITKNVPAAGTWDIIDSIGIRGFFSNVNQNQLLEFNLSGMDHTMYAGNGIRLTVRGWGDPDAYGNVHVVIRDYNAAGGPYAYHFMDPATTSVNDISGSMTLDFPYASMVAPGWGESNNYTNAAEAIAAGEELNDLTIIFQPTNAGPLNGSFSIFDVETY